ncbi:MAG TPA: hypothetical protein ENI88_04995 [Desulfobulbus sp.]|nr:hypothetical protein [Desulfobulbus sp.]
MSRPVNPPGKDVHIRCPRLGHEIYFNYCRRENMGRPCFKVLDCWYPYFKVEEFLRQELTPEEWAALIENPGKPKMVSLVELIEQARQKKE